MSDGELVQVAAIEETSWGIVPASAMFLVDCKSADFKRGRTTGRPEALRGDRRRYASRVLAEQGNITLTCPGKYGNTTRFYEGFQGAHFGATITVTASTISFAAHQVLDSGNGLGGFAVGQWVYISGADDAANNRWVGPITAKTSGALTVPQTLTVHAAGTSITVDTTPCVDGSTRLSYGLEEHFTDLTNTFRAGNGNRVGQLQKTWNVSSFVEEQWTFLGDVCGTATATMGTGTPTAAPTSDFLTTLDTDFILLEEGGSASGLIVSNYQLTGTNNLSLIQGIGRSKGPAGVGVHTQDIDMTMTFYYDAAGSLLVQKAEAHTATSLAWAEKDPQGNSVLYYLPALKPDEGEPQAITINKENMATAKLSAYASVTYGYQFGIFKHTAP